jgi:hypothetical protein
MVRLRQARDALQKYKYPQAEREVVERYTRWILVIYEVKDPKVVVQMGERCLLFGEAARLCSRSIDSSRLFRHVPNSPSEAERADGDGPFEMLRQGKASGKDLT